MSNPAPVPPLPPIAPRRRSLAGPVVLIVMGLVFLMGTMGVLHWHMLWTWFARYWPLLIILWGVIKLAEHFQAQREGVRSSGIGAGGVFLLVFLVMAGLIATSASHVNWQGVHDQFGDWDNSDFGDWFGNTYSYTDQMFQPFPSGGSLHVVSDRGAVNILVSTGNEVKVEVSKKVHAESQQDADKYNQGTKPIITVSGTVVTINANTQGAGDHGVATDMTISVPRRAAVVVSSRHGDVGVTGRDGNADISNQRGDVRAEDINGNVSLSLEHSSAKVANVSGDLSVEGRVNDITISGVKGSARLNGEFMESVKLSQIGKTVSFKSSRTDMEFTKLDGDLDLDSEDLRADSVFGPGRLLTRSKNITLNGVSGDLRVENSNGPVELHIRKVGNIQVDNKDADIQISFPTQAAFRVDARSKGGEIQSDFSELKVNNDENLATASGSVGGGNTSVRLNNQHGSIEIHKATLEAATPAAPKAPKALPAPKDKTEEPTEN